MLRIFWMTAAAILVTTAFDSEATAGVALTDAIKSGQVEVTVTGRGSSSGDAINLYIQRRLPQTVEIDIASGTVFRDVAGKAQSMVFRRVRLEKVAGGWMKTGKIVLNDDRRRMFILEAYCRDMTRPTPKETDQMAVEGANTREAERLARGRDLDASSKVVQSAIWIERDNATVEQLRRYLNVSVDEFKVATHLASAVADVNVKTDPGSTAVGVELKEVKQLLTKLRAKREAQLAASPVARGDRAKVVQDVELKTAPGRGRVMARLPKGHPVEILRNVEDQVLVLTDVEGRRRTGWLGLAVLNVTKKASPESGGVLRDTALEFLNKLDVEVGVDDGVSVGVESGGGSDPAQQ